MTHALGARALAFLALGWLALIVVATLELVTPLSWGCRFAGPDVTLLVVLFVGLQAREGLPSAVAFALVLGYLGDLFTGAPKGLHMLTLCVAMLAARGASSRLLVKGWFATSLVSLAFAVGYGAALAALRVSLDPEIGWGPLRLVLPEAIATALFAPLVFRWLTRLDRRFLRDPRVLRVGGA